MVVAGIRFNLTNYKNKCFLCFFALLTTLCFEDKICEYMISGLRFIKSRLLLMASQAIVYSGTMTYLPGFSHVAHHGNCKVSVAIVHSSIHYH